MERLDPDRIAALVEAAKDGSLPEAAAPSTRRGGRVRTVDFSRPTKFGADQQRRINRCSEMFCQSATTRLSSELHWPLELEILNTQQLTWAATLAQVPPGSLVTVLEVDPIGARMVLTVEQPFILVALECLLGGAPERPARERRLSEIDWQLARGLLESLVTPLSLAWQELGGVALRVGEISSHGPADSTQVATVSEPTYSTFIEVRINHQSYALGLLIPWAAIEPIGALVPGRDGPESEGERETPSRMQRPMSQVPVTVRAEVAALQLRVEDILRLAPGSTIEFDAHVDAGIDLYAANVRLGRAQPGRQGPRRAAQLVHYAESE